MKQQSFNFETRTESTKRKLCESYQEIEKKKRKAIQLSDLRDAPEITKVPILLIVYIHVKNVPKIIEVSILFNVDTYVG